MESSTLCCCMSGARMCKWNLQDLRCVHGHTEHEELLTPRRNRPPVVWCNACWTVCAFYSDKKVKTGLAAAVADAFNGTIRAPPYIARFNEDANDGKRRPPRSPGQRPKSPMVNRPSGTTSQFGNIPSNMPHPETTTRYQQQHVASSKPVPYSRFATPPDGDSDPQVFSGEDMRMVATGPTQNHNMARNPEFEDGCDGLT